MDFRVWLSFSRKMPNDIWTGQRIQNCAHKLSRVRHMWWNETLYKHIRLWFCFFSLCVFFFYLFCLFIARSRLIDKKRGKKNNMKRKTWNISKNTWIYDEYHSYGCVHRRLSKCLQIEKASHTVLSDIWPKSPPKTICQWQAATETKKQRQCPEIIKMSLKQKQNVQSWNEMVHTVIMLIY